ncbi:MAG: hypothetical protein AAGB31_13340, partial [Bdellovibrio sp.]
MKTLHTVDEIKKLLSQGKALFLAGDEKLLCQLPSGNWIGGTIPYFMSERGGLLTHDLIQVTELPSFVSDIRIKSYDQTQLHNIPRDYANNGVSLIVIPAFSGVHEIFAKDCSTYDGLFDRPLVGWITGIDLSQTEGATPKVMDGSTGTIYTNKALVMHVSLPDKKYGKVNILNLFHQGHGDIITFPQTGFETTDCVINGKPGNFAEYIQTQHINTQLPLVANYLGAMINVSVRNCDTANKKVSFYAPVFPGIEYRFAHPVDNYEESFKAELNKRNVHPVFTCNCI